MRGVRKVWGGLVSLGLVACAPTAALRGGTEARPAGVQRGAVAADVTARLEALDAQAPGWLARSGVPSLAVAYVRDGRVLFTRVYGEQSEGVPATPDTLYNVASLTKPLFAEAVLRLASAGELSLDEPLSAHYVDPDLAGDPRAKELTLRLALSHRLGFSNWRRETDGKLAFLFPPGTGYRYSGEGYEYASQFVQAKLRAPLDALAARTVFAPSGMARTAFDAQGRVDAARLSQPKGPQGAYRAATFSPGGNAADDVYTTVGEYAAFVAGVMRGEGVSPALAAERDALVSLDTGPSAACDPARVRRCPTRMGYGLGWGVFEYPAGNALYHTGSDWGEKAMVVRLPASGEAAVLFTNGAQGFDVIIDALGVLLPGSDFADFAKSQKG
jgi:CubicO group peptidase (beta-lactamase class C family)